MLLLLLLPFGPLHVFNRVLGPLVDGVLAIAALSGELREAFLERQSENLHIDVVAELLGHDEEEMPEDKGGKQVNNVGASREQSHTCLVNKGEKGDGCQYVKLDGAQLLEDHVEQTDVQCEVHVVRGAVRGRQGVETRVLPEVAIWVAILE